MSEFEPPDSYSLEPPADSMLMEAFARFGLVTHSACMVPILRKAWKAAHASDATILIEGETGTGKQVLAEAIHHLDLKRGSRGFVTAHCATVQENLAESELFGHLKGSFSGALNSRKGLFRAAQGGTLFLDDVNDLPASIQAKLLDVLQRGVVRPVGSDQEVPTDVRVIAAANKPLKDLVRQNAFRADLYYRLDVVHLQLPPLRERHGDLPALMLALAQRNQSLYNAIEEIDPQLARHLESEQFEGNIRQLEHAVRRMLLEKSSGKCLALSDWMAQATQESVRSECADPAEEAARLLWAAVTSGRITYESAFFVLEEKLLRAALDQPAKTRREIAFELGMSERTFYQKLKDHGLAAKTPRSAAEISSQDAEFSTAAKAKSA